MYGKYYVHTQNRIQNQELYGFTILCDKNILGKIHVISNQEMLVDGTFEIVKRGPYQELFIIYIAFEKQVITFSCLILLWIAWKSQ